MSFKNAVRKTSRGGVENMRIRVKKSYVLKTKEEG